MTRPFTMKFVFSLLASCLLSTGVCAQYDSLLRIPYPQRYEAMGAYIGNLPDTGSQYRVLRELLARAERDNNKRDALCARLYKFSTDMQRHVHLEEIPGEAAALIRDAEEAGNHAVTGNVYIGLGNYYYQDRVNYRKGFEYYLKAYNYYHDLYKDEFPDMSYSHYSLALSYYKFYEYDNALKYSKSLRDEDVSNSYKWVVVFNYDLVGMSYMKLREYDSAILYLRKTRAAASQYMNGGQAAAWQGIAGGNIGLALFKQHKHDEAIPYLEEGIRLTTGQAVWDNVASFAVCLADIYLQQHRMQDAERYLKVARESAYTANTLQNYNELYPVMSSYYRQLGNTALTLQYQDSSLHFRDSLASVTDVANMYRGEIAVADEWRKMNEQLAEKEKQNQLLLRNGLIIIAVMAMLFTLLVYNRKLLKQKYERQRLQGEKKLAEQDLASAMQQLHNFKHNIAEKNDLIASLERELTSGHDTASLAALQQSTILTDEQWESFRQLFEKVHPGFQGRLRNKMPGLTPAETRLMVLGRLGFSNKEMAAALGVSGQAIRTTWYRLRKKLNLPEEGSLEELVERI